MQQVLGKEYKVFGGNKDYMVLMPNLINSGLVPMNMADVMKARLEKFKQQEYSKKIFKFDPYKSKQEKLDDLDKSNQEKFWLYTDLDTGDGVAYYKDKIKIVHDAKALRNIQSYTDLHNGALTLLLEQYRNLKGEEFSVHNLEKAGINKLLTKSEVKLHPIWKSLARDNDLLYEYADFVFKQVEQIYGGDKAMGIYLGFEQKNPTMLAWHIDLPSLGESNASGFKKLSDFTNLVGVSAEGVLQKETLDKKIIDAMKSGKPFKFKGWSYNLASKIQT